MNSFLQYSSYFLRLSVCLAVLVIITACQTSGTGSEPAGSVVKRTEAAIAKAKANQDLQAFIYLAEEQALQQAKELDASDDRQQQQGPLYGRAVVVKDNIHVAGMPNSAGTPGLKQFVPEQDSPVVAALRRAGAVVLGKTNMHELAFGITSDNAAFGSVRNPIDPSKFPGGSSGGTAAAIAAGIADLGLGTDTGGSVRIPAALTGITGLRPTTGRYSNDGVTPVSATRDTIGPMARHVDGLIALDSAIIGHNNSVLPAEFEGLRLGVSRDYFYSGLDPQTLAVTDAALTRLQRAGVVLVEAELPDVGTLVEQSGFAIALFEVVRDLSAYLEEFDIGIKLQDLASEVASADVQGVLAAALNTETAVPQSAYQQALLARADLRQAYRDYFARHNLDAMVFPTTILPARDIEGSMQTVELNGTQVPTFPTYIRNTDPASIAGIPGISLPIGTTNDGLPVGLELDGPINSDRRLLSIGLAVEDLMSK